MISRGLVVGVPEGWVFDLEAANGSGVGEQSGTHEIHRDERRII